MAQTNWHLPKMHLDLGTLQKALCHLAWLYKMMRHTSNMHLKSVRAPLKLCVCTLKHGKLRNSSPKVADTMLRLVYKHRKQGLAGTSAMLIGFTLLRHRQAFLPAYSNRRRQ